MNRHIAPQLLVLKMACICALSPLISAAQPNPISLQALLDNSDYIAYGKAIEAADAPRLSAPQRTYFLGIFAYHVGKLSDAVPYLTTAVNTYKGAKKI